MGEKINNSKKRRSGFLVSINGLEAFLPCNLAFFPYLSNIDEIIGHNVLASVEAISLEKMSVVLSMVDPYENLIKGLSRPELKKDTKGIIYWVNDQSANVLLPDNVHGKIQMDLYQTRDHHDWLDLTGSVISCIPFKTVEWDDATRNYQYKLALS